MIDIYFFAHGTTLENEQHLLSGWNGTILSELGKMQAKELGIHLNPEIFPMIYSSDLPRALQTIELACGTLGVVHVDSRLREVNFGTFTSQSSSLVDKNWEQYIKNPFPEGESYMDVERRMYAFLLDLKKQNYKKIAIVAHEGPQLALDVLLNNKTWQQAMDENWRNTGNWKPGWKYVLN